MKRSGQDSNASVIPGSVSEGIVSETKGDELSIDQMLCNPRTHVLHNGHRQTHGRNDVSTCVHASYAQAY